MVIIITEVPIVTDFSNLYKMYIHAHRCELRIQKLKLRRMYMEVSTGNCVLLYTPLCFCVISIAGHVHLDMVPAERHQEAGHGRLQTLLYMYFNRLEIKSFNCVALATVRSCREV